MIILALLAGSICFAEIDRSIALEDSEVDATLARRWSVETVKERGADAQHKALAYWRQVVANSTNLPPEQAIELLGQAVVQAGNTRIYQVKERLEVYDAATSALVSIPGHAEYFSNRIREAYEPLKDPNRKGGTINVAEREMLYGFGTLKHLTSPETVKVLGEMLSETWALTPKPGDEYTPPALAKPAVETLGALGIRDAPWRPIRSSGDLPGANPAWQAWYDDVKAGRKAFSFKGQAVEYRFKQDGTWDTVPITNPPDDALRIPSTKTAGPSNNPRTVDKMETPKQMLQRRWLWTGITAIAVLGLLAFSLRQRIRG